MTIHIHIVPISIYLKSTWTYFLLPFLVEMTPPKFYGGSRRKLYRDESTSAPSLYQRRGNDQHRDDVMSIEGIVRLTKTIMTMFSIRIWAPYKVKVTNIISILLHCTNLMVAILIGVTRLLIAPFQDALLHSGYSNHTSLTCISSPTTSSFHDYTGTMLPFSLNLLPRVLSRSLLKFPLSIPPLINVSIMTKALFS